MAFGAMPLTIGHIASTLLNLARLRLRRTTPVRLCSAHKKRVYIHIGSDKTGSSAIQEFAFQNADALRKRGLDVVPSTHSHHGPLHDALKRGDHSLLNAAVRHIEHSMEPAFLITFEGLYHLSGLMLADFLAAFSPYEIKVIFYVRLRSDMLRSGFAQNLKLNASEHAKYLDMLFKGADPNKKPNFNYRAIVRRWQLALSTVGQNDAFDLHVYEKSAFKGGDLLCDFFSTIGVLRDGERPESRPFRQLHTEVNPSISPAAQYIMALVMTLGLDDHQRRLIRDLVFQNDSAAEKRWSIIPDDVAYAWDAKYQEQDTELAREFFGRDRLFLDAPQFRFGRPSGEAFVGLIQGIYNGRDSLAFLHEQPPATLTSAESYAVAVRPPEVEPKKDVASILRSARSYRRMGNTNAEKRCLAQIVALRPNHPRANFELAKIMFEEGAESEGLKHLSIARQFAKKDEPWLKELAHK